MHFLNQIHLRYPTPNFRDDVIELIPEKLFGSLLFGQKVGSRRDPSHTDNVLVECKERPPTTRPRGKDQCVVLRLFARNARATDGACDLRKKGDLFVV